ncbi:NADPH-dependent F420 reductase [Paenibacillus sp. GCM10023250]|uniref:NADPH-dependent F420 reductase n=1 Tax=Paenibacillus sp. GCM10023250 TaxID=3252648 RepID=UPI00361DAC25
MRFGFIGAGPMATNIAKKLAKNGHEIKIADARGIERLAGKELAGKPVPVQEVITDIDVLIVSIPLNALPSIRGMIEQVGEDVIIVDTSNYYPVRDGEMEEIENGMLESEWVSKQLGRPIIKAFNNLLAYTLEYKGTPEGTNGRIAISIAGDNEQHKQIIMNVVNEVGFDPVDGGSLSDSWRQQPGTPGYCTELTKAELTAALQKAIKEKARFQRNLVLEKLSAFTEGFTHQDLVNLNRELQV